MSAVDEMDRQDGIIACTPQAVGELIAEIRRLEADNERLRAALQQLVTDYQDVPDPTDADGQAVFEEARRALEPKP